MEGRIGIGIGIDSGRSDPGSDRIEGSAGSQGKNIGFRRRRRRRRRGGGGGGGGRLGRRPAAMEEADGGGGGGSPSWGGRGSTGLPSLDTKTCMFWCPRVGRGRNKGDRAGSIGIDPYQVGSTPDRSIRPDKGQSGGLSSYLNLNRPDRLNRAGIDRSRFDSSDPTQILLSWVDPAGNEGFWGASRGNRIFGGRSDPGSTDSGSIPAILPSMYAQSADPDWNRRFWVGSAMADPIPREGGWPGWGNLAFMEFRLDQPIQIGISRFRQ
ncbi:hypothetical protein Taro_016786 [Colocasia esculenta]|uniref:Uncharacterized protein n=1 Tax=Colocasia esculenta TaxID=4460 RepID=A0A843UTZ8_COLES|nr:hypothetical protein [Colocasia esculenta]